MIKKLFQMFTLENAFCESRKLQSPGQSTTEPSSVIMRVAYKYLKCVQASPELPNTLASVG